MVHDSIFKTPVFINNTKVHYQFLPSFVAMVDIDQIQQCLVTIYNGDQPLGNMEITCNIEMDAKWQRRCVYIHRMNSFYSQHVKKQTPSSIAKGVGSALVEYAYHLTNYKFKKETYKCRYRYQSPSVILDSVNGSCVFFHKLGFRFMQTLQPMHLNDPRKIVTFYDLKKVVGEFGITGTKEEIIRRSRYRYEINPDGICVFKSAGKYDHGYMELDQDPTQKPICGPKALTPYSSVS